MARGLPVTSLGLREHVAEPADLWIRYSFSRWLPGSGGLWCDLAVGSLPPATSGPSPTEAEAVRLVRSATDVIYVPPLPDTEEQLGAAVIAAAADAGVPLLIQVVADYDPEDRSFVVAWPASVRAAELPPDAVVAVDLLDCLFRHGAALREEHGRRRQPRLAFEPASLRGATVVWPLVADWTDQSDLLEPALARLAAAGARRVLPRDLRLKARERRLLAEGLQASWPEAFDALFHGDDSRPDHSAFRCAAEAAGLEHRLPRPLPALPLPSRLRRSRELAGHLIELGDAAATHGDAYYRAARFLDRNEVDIDAAAREGNLGVLPWLEDPARVAVEAWLARHGGG